MSNVLVTAIGSMSATMVLKTLDKVDKHQLVGTDIYPKEWQPNFRLVSQFYRVGKATSQTYIQEILDICIKNDIQYIIPLTDPEVDRLSENRIFFDEHNIILCISSTDTILKCRDKSQLGSIFNEEDGINVIPSLTWGEIQNNNIYPIIAKPKKGRSSEGLYKLKNKEGLSVIDNPADYLFQPFITGEIFTVDFIRDISGNNFALPRQELIRTSNGAGITVDVQINKEIQKAASTIGEKLKIIGCVNFEFLYDGHIFYLMDINPRFSAGVGFSVVAGYNFISNHLRCFQNKDIDMPSSLKEGILSRISDIV